MAFEVSPIAPRGSSKIALAIPPGGGLHEGLLPITPVDGSIRVAGRVPPWRLRRLAAAHDAAVTEMEDPTETSKVSLADIRWFREEMWLRGRQRRVAKPALDRVFSLYHPGEFDF